MWSEEQKEEAIRLRVEERASLNEISSRLEVPKTTIFGWVRNHPLTDEEKKHRRQEAGRRSRGRSVQKTRQFVELPLDYREYTTDEKGRISEAAVALRLVLHRHEVYATNQGNGYFDLVVRLYTGGLVSLQVKTVYWASQGNPILNLRHSGSKKRYVDFDFIVGYDPMTDSAYVFSKQDVSGKAVSVAVTEESREAWDKLTE